MNFHSRRDFITKGGLAVTGGWMLLGDVTPTEASGGLGEYASFVTQPAPEPAPAGTLGAIPPAQPRQNWVATEDNIEGPYYRAAAPFRAKVTPPLEPGTPLLLSGRIYGLDTRRPLANAVIDIWQANADGRYDNDDPQRPPAPNVFLNRARLITDENGYYEFETIHPGPYRTGPNTWRPSHIHYLVRHTNYRQLITQLYFRGDRYNAADEFIRASLIIDLTERRTRGQTYKTGTFDIVLAPMARGR